jgi:hypothetical protein
MRRSLHAHVASLAIVAASIALLSSSASCSGKSSLCHPTSRDAAEKILAAWCARYTQCDPSRGTSAKCVEDRIGTAAVPTDDGCVAGCTDDTDECRRSSCKDDRVEECRKASSEMACADQVKESLVRYPNFCDTCFN